MSLAEATRLSLCGALLCVIMHNIFKLSIVPHRFSKTPLFPGHFLHEKGLRIQRFVDFGLQPEMKSGRRPADKALMNRESIAFDALGARITVVSCANKRVGVPSCRARPAQLPRHAPPDPTSPWCVRVLDSTG